MQTFLDFSKEEMCKILVENGFKRFRADQIFNGLYQGKSFNEISTLPQDLVQWLQNNYSSICLTIIDEKISRDGTVKFAFKLSDDNVIEAVLMSYKYGYTLCVSTQVGCRMHCKFCASGLNGLVRNLTSGEMLCEVLLANKYLNGKLKDGRKITNVVLMGSGEPLDNYDNVVKFLKHLSCEDGLNISERNISLSTCGLVDNIKKLADDGRKVTLTISLHAVDDDTRKMIMPIARRYTIAQILEACEYYFKKTNRRIVFEYTLVKNVNDDLDNAQKMAHLFRKYHFPYHINVINMNENDKMTELESTGREYAKRFVNALTKFGISATLRRTMGDDIEGACGQLRRKIIEKDDNNK